MKLWLSFPVARSPKTVFEGFGRDLFWHLRPPFMPLSMVRFDGCGLGDVFHLQLGKGIFTTHWVGRITEVHEGPNEFWFVDEGDRLPWPLKAWRHRHLIVPNGSGALVCEDISYSCGYLVGDLLLWPMMWLLFSLRGPGYRGFFEGQR